MKTIALCTITLFAGAGVGFSVQDKQDKKPADATAGMPKAKPGPEHEALQKQAGTWDAVVKYPAGEHQGVKFPGGESKGTMITAVMDGGFFIVEDFKGEFMGEPFTGKGVTGYDPARGKYVSWWCDSACPSPSISMGTFDKDKKTMTLKGENPNMDGKLSGCTTVTTWQDADHYTMKMWEDGKEKDAMTITFSRKSGGAKK